MKKIILLTCVVTAWFLFFGQIAQAAKLALVIGNDKYRNVTELKNAGADAKAIGKALEQAGYRVDFWQDLDEKKMKAALRTFREKVSGGDEAVVFYSGHGMQLAGSNYLLPVDIKGETESQVKDEAIPLQRILEDLQEQKAKFTLAVIDACRDNPFKNQGKAIGGRGLAPTTAASGQMVIYSAGTGQQALDRLGESDRNTNGVFTRVFLEEMKKPGVPIDRVLKKVRERVVELAKSVQHEQVPALYDQVVGEYYFHLSVDGVVVPAPAPQPSAPAANLDALFWESVKDSSDPASFALYLKKFPKGEFVELAQLKIKQLKAQSSPVAVAKPAEPVVQVQPTSTPVAAPVVAKTESAMGMEFVTVPKGCFQMGDNFGDGYDWEKPVHEVCVDSFRMGKYEVTQVQWEKVMGSNPSNFKGGQNPVEQVSWDEVQSFIGKINTQTGKSYRLPTEAEWEYACRSGGKQEKYCGGDNLDNLGWYDKNSGSTTHPVGQKQANGLGLYDMSGNVWEWCSDWFDDKYYASSPRQNPSGPSFSSNRVDRGGSWYNDPGFARSAVRSSISPGNRSGDLGLRLVLPPGQ